MKVFKFNIIFNGGGFFCGIAIGKNKKVDKYIMLLSVFVNLGMLTTLKYCNFFIESATVILNEIGLTVEPIYLQLTLPVGISFYTFQTLSLYWST